jgi:hypothetical protein
MDQSERTRELKHSKLKKGAVRDSVRNICSSSTSRVHESLEASMSRRNKKSYPSRVGMAFLNLCKYIRRYREHEDHAYKCVTLKESSVDAGEIEFRRRPVLVDQSAQYQDERRIVNRTQTAR